MLTCHPYSQNYQRYVVYLRRIDENSSSSTIQREDEKNQEEIEGDTVVKLDISSQETIRQEQILNNIGITVTIVMTAVILIVWVVSAYKKRRR